jgi:hypothetical protein
MKAMQRKNDGAGTAALPIMEKLGDLHPVRHSRLPVAILEG